MIAKSPRSDRSLATISLLCILLITILGCGESREATASDETFFKPLRPGDRGPRQQPAPVQPASAQAPPAQSPSVQPPPVRPAPAQAPPTQPALARPPRVEPVKPAPLTAKKADTSRAVPNAAERRIAELQEQLRLLESSRNGVRTDTARAVVRPPTTTQTNAIPAATSENGLAEAERLYEAREYRRTIEYCQEQLRKGSGEESTHLFNFYIGASHYNLRRFDPTLVFLKKALQAPGSKKRAETLFILGMTYGQLAMTSRSREMFETLLRESPPADLAQSARRELQKLEKNR